MLSVCPTSGVPPKLDHMVVYVGVDDMLGVLSRVYHREDIARGIADRGRHPAVGGRMEEMPTSRQVGADW